MKLRIITAAVLVPARLAILFVAPKFVTALLFGVFCAVAVYEMLYNTKLVHHIRLIAYSMLAAFLVPLWCFWGMDPIWGKLGVFIFFALLFMEAMLAKTKLRIERLALCVFAGLLIPYLLSSFVRIIAMEYGRYFVIIPFIVGFLSDTGAYFVGCRFGKHKLAPVISPNKSIEGVVGGLACAIVGMLIYGIVMRFAFRFDVNFLAVLLYGFVGALCGVFGDLCFSVIKRQTGIKDYGNLFPGHGGVLDRFDSMVMVGAAMELLLVLIPLVK